MLALLPIRLPSPSRIVAGIAHLCLFAGLALLLPPTADAAGAASGARGDRAQIDVPELPSSPFAGSDVYEPSSRSADLKSLLREPAFETPTASFQLAGPNVEPCDDADGDEVCDEDDNCVVVANAGQEDVDEDGIGNVCECGDASKDGRVTTIDARLIQRCAVSDLTDPNVCEGLCDVTGDGRCNTVDARIIQRLAVGQIQKSSLVCAARPAAP